MGEEKEKDVMLGRETRGVWCYNKALGAGRCGLVATGQDRDLQGGLRVSAPKGLFDCSCHFTGPFQAPKGCKVASHLVSFGSLLFLFFLLIIAESVLRFATPR